MIHAVPSAFKKGITLFFKNNQHTTWTERYAHPPLPLHRQTDPQAILDPHTAFSNNNQPAFSATEALTVYFFGLIQHHYTLKHIHQYAFDHLHDGFPDFPSYTAFVQRLNRLSEGLPDLVEQVLACCSRQDVLKHIRLVDSMPVVMANAKRSSQAKVAIDFANKGYCASKNIYFHRVKLHVVAKRCPGGALPLPEYIALAPGSANDLTMLRPIVEQLPAG